MTTVANACVILHNIIIHKTPGGEDRDWIPDATPRTVLYPIQSEEFEYRMDGVRDEAVNSLLKRDLTAHLWENR